MKQYLGSLLVFLLIALFLSSAGCTNPQPVTVSSTVPAVSTVPVPPASGASPETRDDLVAFVKRATTFAQTAGKEKALAEFDKKNGSFFSGQLYIYAYDFNGTTIAHPVNPEKIGVNRLSEKDARGGFFIRELRDQAINGSGFSEYYYINPVHNNTVEKKLGYVMKVDDSWWLGSGIYEGPADVGNTQALAGNLSPAGTTATATADGGKRMVTFTEADNGKTGIITQNTRFAIELAENPTTGFMWNSTLSPGLELQSSDFRQSPAAPGMTGVGGTRTWIIIAKDLGDQKFSATYQRSWENVTGDETAYRVNIRVVGP